MERVATLPPIKKDGFRYIDDRPLTIGITLAQQPLPEANNGQSYLQRTDYETVLTRLGASVIAVLPGTHIADSLRMMHGLVIAGGHDIDMVALGRPPIDDTKGRRLDSPMRTEHELSMLRAMEEDMALMRPVLGVCYGSQLLAVGEGAELLRIYGHEGVAHPIKLQEDFLGICAADDQPHFESRHGLQIAGLSPESQYRVVAEHEGVIEAIRHNVHPFFGIQSHPETPLSEEYTKANQVLWRGVDLYEGFVREIYSFHMDGQATG